MISRQSRKITLFIVIDTKHVIMRSSTCEMKSVNFLSLGNFVTHTMIFSSLQRQQSTCCIHPRDVWTLPSRVLWASFHAATQRRERKLGNDSKISSTFHTKALKSAEEGGKGFSHSIASDMILYEMRDADDMEEVCSSLFHLPPPSCWLLWEKNVDSEKKQKAINFNFMFACGMWVDFCEGMANTC